jgi:hypothetical protein
LTFLPLRVTWRAQLWVFRVDFPEKICCPGFHPNGSAFHKPPEVLGKVCNSIDWEERKMVVKRTLCGLFFLMLASGVLLAQGDLKVAHTTHVGTITPAEKAPVTLKVIYSNLGPSASDDYNDTTGYYILGPDNSEGLSEQYIALPFTPAKASHVEELQVAVGSISGTSLVDVGLYSDASGIVGSPIATGQSTKIPAFGACCQLVSVKIPSTAVAAGTQYWIVVSTNDTKAANFTGVFEASNQSNIGGNVALEGWFTFSGNVPAAAALGTIP